MHDLAIEIGPQGPARGSPSKGGRPGFVLLDPVSASLALTAPVD